MSLNIPWWVWLLGIGVVIFIIFLTTDIFQSIGTWVGNLFTNSVGATEDYVTNGATDPMAPFSPNYGGSMDEDPDAPGGF